jgi:Cys-rich protein (TIGR01571 family)
MAVQELAIDAGGKLARQSRAGLNVESDVYVNATQQSNTVMASLQQIKRNTNFLPILVSEDVEKDGKSKEQLIANAVSTIIECVIGLVFAYLYKSKVVDGIPKLVAREPNSAGKDFQFGLFGCCSSTHLCLHTCCCWQCRVAHTYQVTDVMDYWPTIFLTGLCGCFMPCIGACYGRKKLRVVLGLEEDTCMDFVKYCFCSLCAVGEEAMQVDKATSVNVFCCCSVVTDEQMQQAVQDNQSAQPALTNEAEPLTNETN